MTAPNAPPALDATFAALGDPTRRAILERLSAGPATISELAAPFEMSLTAVSKHVRVLERAGLLRRELRGRSQHCSLEPLPLREATQWAQQFREFWEHRLDGLERYLEERAPS